MTFKVNGYKIRKTPNGPLTLHTILIKLSLVAFVVQRKGKTEELYS